MMEKDYQMTSIPKEKFAFVQKDARIHDERLQTKPVSYLGDAWNRFRTNKSAVVAFVLILLLLLFALIVPPTSNYTVSFRDGYYKTVLPKCELFQNSGFWDGGKRERQSSAGYEYLNSIGQENGKSAIMKIYSSEPDATGETYYDLRMDTYNMVGYVYVNLSEAEYRELLAYQEEKGIQVCYPLPATLSKHFVRGNDGANFWYKLKDETQGSAGGAVLDENGNFIPNYLTSSNPEQGGYNSLRIAGDGENGVYYTYAQKNQTGYRV
ncbi:MAG: hypothetical protein IJ174_02065, partial [Clostridia bacterium]|nr:hypothetical protein [Clostridia bacterium]